MTYRLRRGIFGRLILQTPDPTGIGIDGYRDAKPEDVLVDELDTFRIVSCAEFMALLERVAQAERRAEAQRKRRARRSVFDDHLARMAAQPAHLTATEGESE